MANSNKTKAEILLELESIKGLLLEEDNIPILQTIDLSHDNLELHAATHNPAFVSGQSSLFDESMGHKKTDTDQITSRAQAKASGENPFLPQHIRERLHGNNPPPLFEYDTAKKILNATKHIAHKINKPRQALVDDVVHSLLPQIEAELRHRLFAMSVEDLQKLLQNDQE